MAEGYALVLLLDTHALVWLASAQQHLSARARLAIRQNPDELYVSSISAFEIAILAKRKRLSLPVAPAEFLDRALGQHGIHELSLDRGIAVAAAALPDIHNDPFDRIIVATARLNGMKILSKDRIIPQYPDVSVVW